MLAEYRQVPALTNLSALKIEGASITATRIDNHGTYELQAALPAVVSISDKADKPRFPNFKGIMAAKKAEIKKLSLAEIGVAPEQVGLSHAATAVTAAADRPERSQGDVIGASGAAEKIAEYLASENLI